MGMLRPVLAFVLAASAVGLPASAPKVIIMQLSDDWGWSNWGLHNNLSAAVTPNLDALAHQGVILSRHYVFSYCSPSRCALQTGRNPIHVNVLNSPVTQHNKADPMSGQQGIPVNMTGLATKLASAGYVTHAYGKYNVGMARPEQTPGSRGYQHALVYFDYGACFRSGIPNASRMRISSISLLLFFLSPPFPFLPFPQTSTFGTKRRQPAAKISQWLTCTVPTDRP